MMLIMKNDCYLDDDEDDEDDEDDDDDVDEEDLIWYIFTIYCKWTLPTGYLHI